MRLQEPEIAETVIKRILSMSADSHDIFTPFKLCNEIIEKIPSLDGKILVVSNLEFVYNMISNGVDKDNLYFATPCPIKKRAAIAWVPESNIIIYNNVIAEEDINMKFDVVVGNPPYQYGHGSNRTLYHKFYELAISKSNKYVAFIAPTTWLTSRKKLLIDLRSSLFSAGLSSVKLLNAQKTFGVAIDSLGYTLQDVTKPSISTSVELLSGEVIETGDFQAILSGGLASSILNKVKGKKYKLNTQRGRHYNVGRNGTCWDNSCSFNKSSSHPYKMINKVNVNNDIEYAFVNKQSPKSAINTPKVMFSYLTSQNNLGTVLILTNKEELSHMCVYISVNTITEGNNLKSYITSKLFKYILPLLRPNTTNTVGVFRDVGMPPLTQSWTDEELYEHFDLTKEEIKLIEETIK